MLLPPGWYAVAASNELKSNKPLSLQCFGQDIVLWRQSDGTPVAMLDKCPHRSAKLSGGELKNNSIQCPFHGFSFDSVGACIFIPETCSSAVNLRVKTYHVKEMHDFLWLWYCNQDSDLSSNLSPSPEVPWFSSLTKNKWSYSQQVTQWPTHISRCIENQLDYAHLPFVHANTIGNNIDVTKPVKFETSNNSIVFYPSGAKSKQGYIEFLFPNIWMLTIIPNKFAQMMAFVPVNQNTTKLYLRGYQSFVTLFGLSGLVNTIGAWQSRYILNQDRQVVLSQRPTSSLEATDEVLYPSDTGVKFFRQRWLETQE